MELWKNIEGYDNRYQVSNFGRVKSISKNIILASHITNKGYIRISLCKNNIYKRCRIHRLVAKAFIPNPLNFPQVNHKDGNKLNNNDWNLEWCDQNYNMKHAFLIGLKNHKGDKSPRKKLTMEIVNEIRNRYKSGNHSHKDLGIEFGVTKQNITSIINYKSWKDHG